MHEDAESLGFSDGTTDLWLIVAEARHNGSGFHRKRTELNHLAFRVDSRAAVDRFAQEFLAPRGLATRYDTPRDFPEYAAGYRAGFSEDPDRLKLDVAHVPNPMDAPHA